MQGKGKTENERQADHRTDREYKACLTKPFGNLIPWRSAVAHNSGSFAPSSRFEPIKGMGKGISSERNENLLAIASYCVEEWRIIRVKQWQYIRFADDVKPKILFERDARSRNLKAVRSNGENPNQGCMSWEWKAHSLPSYSSKGWDSGFPAVTDFVRRK
ncbi:hypothetical protein K438DRAFT_1768176 [Mycena galopus ATCC 62051]|nr:hypothetical protein K438DRAFT_1768176 [Mycena galopus ATCC 62051]